jgi:hypothetical protein
MLLSWTRQKPETPGWYWMLSPDHHSNLPAVIQIVFEGQIGGCLALIPACQDPKHTSRGNRPSAFRCSMGWPT